MWNDHSVSDARISWRTPEDGLTLASESELRETLRSIERSDAAEMPVIVSLEVAGAMLTHVVGDPAGSSLVYFPPGYPDTGLRSMHSVRDATGRASDLWEPPQIAYMNGQYSEMPRWMVVPVAVAEDALVSFMQSGGQPPETIEWELD